jgi:hypothetical protein
METTKEKTGAISSQERKELYVKFNFYTGRLQINSQEKIRLIKLHSENRANDYRFLTDEELVKLVADLATAYSAENKTDAEKEFESMNQMRRKIFSVLRDTFAMKGDVAQQVDSWLMAKGTVKKPLNALGLEELKQVCDQCDKLNKKEQSRKRGKMKANTSPEPSEGEENTVMKVVKGGVE